MGRRVFFLLLLSQTFVLWGGVAADDISPAGSVPKPFTDSLPPATPVHSEDQGNDKVEIELDERGDAKVLEDGDEDEETLLVNYKSKYQHFWIYDTLNDDGGYSKKLYIEGQLQSSTRDEYVYHESLVHPVMLAHPSPKRVVILGGGEGATLRTVLSHRTVEKCSMVELDRAIIEQCNKHMPEMNDGAFTSPRSELLISDAYKFAKKYAKSGKPKYDVAIMDILDPEDIVIANNRAAAHLYEDRFFKYISQRLLTDDGVFVMQAGGTSAIGSYFEQKFDLIEAMLSRFFEDVLRYMVYVPSFSAEWSFLLGCKKAADCRRISLHSHENVMGYIKAEMKARGVPAKNRKFYDHITHFRLFSMPPSLRRDD